jgi:DNA mismatch repair protein MutL
LSTGPAATAVGLDERALQPRRIEFLDALVADQIAAGEVIERPASAVKELVENALDAGAREIEVEIRDGGRELVVVRDDGSGMRADDAHRACLRHATSKLRRLEDLGSIASQGFRGEALASIAAVAEVTITTRVRGEDAGTRVVVAAGVAGESAPAGAPPGTTVEVRGLFAAIPARRKFLRSAATETSHVTELLQRLALVRPGVGFACRQGGREILRYPAVTRSEERLRQVFGAPRTRAMLPLSADGGEVVVRGFVSRAGESFAQAKGVLTYVNGRPVRDRVVLRAILDAYRGLVPHGRYPCAVVAVEVPGTLVDVNVHPTKTEVRFARGDAVYRCVLGAVREALAAGAVAPAAPASRPGEAPPGAGARTPGAPTGRAAAEPAPSAAAGDGAREVPGARVAEALRAYAARAAAAAPEPERASVGAARPRRGVGPGAARGPEAMAPHPAGPGLPAVPRFADLRVIGQAFAGYVVCEAADALVLVDQHAAHERVRFERLRASGALGPESGAPGQRLLVPRVVELDARACAVLLGAATDLVAAGFEIEPFGEGSLLVRALPAALDVGTDPEVLLAEVAADLGAGGSGERLAAARDALLARIACHGAVRFGQTLAREEMVGILLDLDTIPFAATCPHGRPLMIELPRAEMARRVRRV